MCLLLLLSLISPRLAIVVWWLFQPARWELTFDTFLVPFLGFLLLPWTTLMYVLVARGGVNGIDYFWILLALLIDLSGYVGGSFRGRG